VGVIGVTVFERGEALGQSVDLGGRGQARRLRSKLTLYYETEGCADSVLVELPCGGYVPVFRLRAVLSAAPIPLRTAIETVRVDARRSVVVLPFVNMGPEENERLSDGLTEELIYGLSGNTDLRVVARTSAFHFKGKTDDIRSIGERLGVDALVEGSVRSDGNRFRIAAGLIDVRDGGLLWSGVYEQTADEMFAIQKDISERIAKSVEAHLLPPPAAAPSEPATFVPTV